MQVLKFGGTSVATTEAIQRVIALIDAKRAATPQVVVVSALGGVTDLLLKTAQRAHQGDSDYADALSAIEARHLTVIRELVPLQQQAEVLSWFKQHLNQLEDVFRGIHLTRELTPKVQAWVLSYGERWSAHIIHAALPTAWERTALWNPMELIRTDDHYLAGIVDMPLTQHNLREAWAANPQVVIVPGFVAANAAGDITTLGRGGSDYTAALIAAALQADTLEIWSDVAGMMTADPRLVPAAQLIEEVTYEEAMELAHFGAKVLYTPTVLPVLPLQIPIHIRNTFDPDGPGTWIRTEQHSGREITGLSAIKSVALLTLSGAGMVGVPGYASRMFAALYQAEVNVILITQASSEHSIGVAINENDILKAVAALEAAFEMELARGAVNPVKVEDRVCIVALVGENMKHRSGLAGQTFGVLGHNGVNVKAIAQGSSERNISLVVQERDLAKALNVLHEEFFLNTTRKIHCFVVGLGLVGSELLRQMEAQQAYLLENHATELLLCGIANSRRMLLDVEGIPLHEYAQALEERGVPSDIDAFIQEMSEFNLRHSVWVDNTANAGIANYYGTVLNQHVSVVASNKVAASGPLADYLKLKQLAKQNRVNWRFETNVGAGLPVIDQLNGLMQSGDRIRKIEAVLSGSLNFIFSQYDTSRPFAEVVREAKERGFTEPDPRVDLGGVDVARKLLILARESGYSLEASDIDCQGFLPESVPTEGPIEDFFQALEASEEHFKKEYGIAEAQDKRLRMVASLDRDSAKVSLEKVAQGHPCYDLQGTDNLILFYTDRYGEQPLVVRGAGAGAGVTAAGVFADILRTQAYQG